MDLEAGTLGDSAGDNPATLFVRSENRHIQSGLILDDGIPWCLRHDRRTRSQLSILFDLIAEMGLAMTLSGE